MMYTSKLKIAVLALLLSILIIFLAAVLFRSLQKQLPPSPTHAGTTENTIPKETAIEPNTSVITPSIPKKDPVDNKNQTEVTKDTFEKNTIHEKIDIEPKTPVITPSIPKKDPVDNKNQTEVTKDTSKETTIPKETAIKPKTSVIALPVHRKNPVANTTLHKKKLSTTDNLILCTSMTLPRTRLTKHILSNIYTKTSDQIDITKLTNEKLQQYLNNPYDITTAKPLIEDHATLLKIVKDPSLTIPDTPSDDGIANLVRKHIEHIKSALCIDETICRTIFHNRVITAAILENMFIKTHNTAPDITLIHDLVTHCHKEGYYAIPMKLIRTLFKKRHKKSNAINHGNSDIDLSLSISQLNPTELQCSIAGNFIINNKQDKNEAEEVGYLLQLIITSLNESSICYKDIKLQLTIPDTISSCIPNCTYNHDPESSDCMYLASKSRIKADKITTVVYSFSGAIQTNTLINKQYLNTVCNILSSPSIQYQQQTTQQQ